MSDAVLHSHAELLRRYLVAVRAVSGELPMTEHDPERPSPCEVTAPDAEENVLWRPVQRVPAAELATLQRDADITLSDDLRAWLGAWWCLPFEASLGDESLILLGIGGPADEAAFGAQLGAHLAARRARSEPDTVPIGALGDGRFLTVDNVSGRVLLESPAKTLGVVAPSLAALLSRLTPLAL